MLAAGELPHRISIEAPVDGTGDYGEPVRTWKRVADRWAQVQPLSGSEQFQAMQVIATCSHVIRIRYMDGITSRMRIRYPLGSARIFEIGSAIDVDERHETLELLCTETKA